MIRIAPVRLSFNPRTLWFDAAGLELSKGDAVIVQTARGEEYGTVSEVPFDVESIEDLKLKSPLKPVDRLATEEDTAHEEELIELSQQALPIFRQMAAESAPDMHPVAVEYLFSGEKAIFYFESEDRVDFRDLVRRLASEFHVRVDMKQIGVRDGARLVGGLGHCGQELCCRRWETEFKPVSIRMAKEQDLSLNPQKISGVCGRLMCCLRFEFDAYKDFHSRAPKKNARIETPDGEGKVVDLDVPREIISIKVGDEKPVKIPLADMEPVDEGRPHVVGEKAWEKAQEPEPFAATNLDQFFGTSELAGNDKLAEPGSIRRTGSTKKDDKGSRRRNRGGKSQSNGNRDRKGDQKQGSEQSRKPRRRRSTTVNAEGAQGSSKGPKDKGSSSSQANGGKPKSSKVGRNSSALRANRPQSDGGKSQGEAPKRSNRNRRRRTHKSDGGADGQDSQ